MEMVSRQLRCIFVPQIKLESMKSLWMKVRGGMGLLFLLCCVSCMNGGDSPWVGRWQLREYQYPDGKVQRVDSVFYGFQKGSFIALYMNAAGTYENMYGYYEEGNDSLTIHLWKPNVDNSAYQKWFGWQDATRSFRVMDLTSKSMRLDYRDTVYVFRSY